MFLHLGELMFRDPRRCFERTEVHGLERLHRLQEQGKPLILLIPHAVPFEFGVNLLARLAPVVGVARLHEQEHVMDWVVRRMRLRPGAPIYAHDALLSAVKVVRTGRALVYLPDEDRGSELSEFVPFFGVEKLTIAALGRLARACGAAVLTFTTAYDPERVRFTMTIGEPLEAFPTGDRHEDTLRTNQALEAALASDPAQYDWTRRIFRSRPPGADAVYR